MLLKGKIKRIEALNVVSEKFSKREFVIETSDQYPQDVKFQLVNDKCSKIDAFGIGQEVEVSFNIRGKDFVKDEKILLYNSLDAYEIK